MVEPSNQLHSTIGRNAKLDGAAWMSLLQQLQQIPNRGDLLGRKVSNRSSTHFITYSLASHRVIMAFQKASYQQPVFSGAINSRG